MRFSPLRRAAIIDLLISLAVFVACFCALPTISAPIKYLRGISFVFCAAILQFCCEGVAPLTLMLWRRESFTSYGLTRKRLATSLLLGLALAALYDLGCSWAQGALLWIPFGGHGVMRRALAAPPSSAFLGVVLVLLSWGFMESFFGVYFARKVHGALGHAGRGWLAPGAIAFALFNGAIHAMIGQGLAGFLTSFASGYAIAVIPAVTENSWGSVLVQTLTDAIGKLR